MERLNLLGSQFGKLTVVREATYRDKTAWECQCECGNTVVVRTNRLRNNETRSCGCLRRETSSKLHTTHGKSKTPERIAWMNMKQRCYNPKKSGYENYGGRGIKVCSRWLNSFEAFLVDMGNKPRGTSLDRKDNEGDYSRLNCYWATSKEQANNRRKRRDKVVDTIVPS